MMRYVIQYYRRAAPGELPDMLVAEARVQDLEAVKLKRLDQLRREPPTPGRTRVRNHGLRLAWRPGRRFMGSELSV